MARLLILAFVACNLVLFVSSASTNSQTPPEPIKENEVETNAQSKPIIPQIPEPESPKIPESPETPKTPEAPQTPAGASDAPKDPNPKLRQSQYTLSPQISPSDFAESGDELSSGFGYIGATGAGSFQASDVAAGTGFAENQAYGEISSVGASGISAGVAEGAAALDTELVQAGGSIAASGFTQLAAGEKGGSFSKKGVPTKSRGQSSPTGTNSAAPVPAKPTLNEPANFFNFFRPTVPVPAPEDVPTAKDEVPVEAAEAASSSGSLFGFFTPPGVSSISGFFKPLAELSGSAGGQVTLSGGASLAPLLPSKIPHKPLCPEAIEVCHNVCLEVGKHGGSITEGNCCSCTCPVPPKVDHGHLCCDSDSHACDRFCRRNSFYHYSGGQCNSVTKTCDCFCRITEPIFPKKWGKEQQKGDQESSGESSFKPSHSHSHELVDEFHSLEFEEAEPGFDFTDFEKKSPVGSGPSSGKVSGQVPAKATLVISSPPKKVEAGAAPVPAPVVLPKNPNPETPKKVESNKKV